MKIKKINIAFLSFLVASLTACGSTNVEDNAETSNVDEINLTDAQVKRDEGDESTLFDEDFTLLYESTKAQDEKVLNTLWGPDEYGWQADASAGSSKGRIVKESSNKVLCLKYDGISSGSNANAVYWNSSAMKKGTGVYTISFDVKCDGFSTGDNLNFKLYGPDYVEDGATKYCNTGDIKVAWNIDDYNALSDSTKLSGYKHFETSYTVTNSNWNFDTIRFDHWLHNPIDANVISYIDNIEVKKANVVLVSIDFEDYNFGLNPYFPLDGGTAKSAYNGFGTIEGQNRVLITSDNNNAVIKLSNTGEKASYSSFYKFVDFKHAGTYRLEFDLKISDEFYYADFGFLFAGPDTLHNSESVSIIQYPSEYNALDDASISGYKHVSKDIFMDNFQYLNCDSLSVYMSISKDIDSYAFIDNLKLTLVKANQVIEITDDVSSLPYTSLINLGDFESMPLGYEFVDEYDDVSHYWKTTVLDTPAKVTGDDNNHYLVLQSYGASSLHYCSTYYDVMNTYLKTDVIYRLSFDYYQHFVEGNTINTAWHVSFVDNNNHESYKCYLNADPSLKYLEGERSYTNGVNEQSYKFNVTKSNKLDGWYHFEMLFKLNYQFLRQASMIRWVFDSENNKENYVYLDNIDLGAYAEIDTYADPENIDYIELADKGGQL